MMYIECQKGKNGKPYYFLRESKRVGKRIIKTTLLNITPWGEMFCEQFKTFLKNRQSLLSAVDIDSVSTVTDKSMIAKDDIDKTTFQSFLNTPSVFTQGKSFGAVWLLFQVANRLGIVDALGDSEDGRLALWQVLARTMDPGSRLSSTRLLKGVEADFLRLPSFDEDRLYLNLDWIADHQKEVEQNLYKRRWGEDSCDLFLYDVTSSYFEGEQNELAAYGYNRDKKRGKKQIVIGLLCDRNGLPVSIEVFTGNTNDLNTFHSQVQRVVEQYHSPRVTFVGDRGMIKSAQQTNLKEHGFHYITALTRKQIETLLAQERIQYSLFDEDLSEIVLDDKRYIMRRNPIRADKISSSRDNKRASMLTMVSTCNQYLVLHKKTKVETQERKVTKRINKLGCSDWLSVSTKDRTLELHIDKEQLAELVRLDGCYCLISDIPVDAMDKEEIHSRYKDLSMVENAFRTMKTINLEMRPLYVRKKSRTRGHAFVVMLSFLIIKELRNCWINDEVTPKEGIQLLRELCIVEAKVQDKHYALIPQPRTDIAALYKHANVTLPEAIPSGPPVDVASKRKLKSRRKTK